MRRDTGVASQKAQGGRRFVAWRLRVAAWGALFVGLALLPAIAAAGTQNYAGVTVSVEPPADASTVYGYAVYRVTVANRGGQAHTVKVTLPAESYSYGDSIRRITRTVRVEPNSTATAELLQPPLEMNGSDAAVSIDGKPQQDHVPVALADHMSYNGGEALLVGRGVDGAVMTEFETAMTEIEDSGHGGSYGGYRGGYGGYSNRLASMARADRPVGEWSGNWLAYSRYLAVMVGEDELRSAPAAVDAALRDYVAAGGVLVVVGAGGAKPGLSGAWEASWTRPGGGDTDGGTLLLGAGHVNLVAADALVDFSVDQWGGWIEERLSHTRQRKSRLDSEDAERRLPMLEQLEVPTVGLLGMMFLFTVIIGPVNLLVLWWFKRRMWLLWTIPLIAFVFAGAVLAYSLLSEGVRPRVKTVAVTLLDQRTRQAVTLGTQGYYAPLTPGGGLRFDDRTEIVPQSSDVHSGYGGYSGYGRPRSLDVSNGQHLSSGWVIARVPAHFQLRQVESRRERLDISRDADGGLTVVNGLGLPIKRLVIADAQGRVYEASSLAAGASGPASPTTHRAQTLTSMQERIQQRGAWDTARNFAANPEAHVAPGSYIAVFDNASFLNPGLDGLTGHEVTGTAVGRWEETR